VPQTIAIVGSLDTKGVEFAFLKAEIERRGCRPLVINTGVLGAPLFPPEVSAEELALAAGTRLEDLVARADRGQALDAMTEGVAIVVRRLFDEGRFDGIVSMGGGGGTAMGTSAMRALPVGVPKLMVTTVASGDTRAYVGTTDITMMPSIVDVSGLNRISRTIFSNAAGAICGMVDGERARVVDDNRPLMAASMFGNTTRGVDHVRQLLEARGYEVLVFHATGTGGKTMEMLIEQSYFDGVVDFTTTEWADELCGGVLSAGPGRLEAAASSGTPQVVTPGCIDMVNFWAAETIPVRYRDRLLHHWNPNVTLMRTTPDENLRLGEIFAQKLNSARGPVAIVVPMLGFSEIDAPGKPFWWPAADRAFVDALKDNLRPDIPVTLLDNNVNDPAFSEAVTETMLDMLHQTPIAKGESADNVT